MDGHSMHAAGSRVCTCWLHCGPHKFSGWQHGVVVATRHVRAIQQAAAQRAAHAGVLCLSVLQGHRRRVCVGLDGSRDSRAALRWTLLELLRLGDELHLLSAATPLPFPLIPVRPPVPLQWRTTDAKLCCASTATWCMIVI
jgi:hypothetical protein